MHHRSFDRKNGSSPSKSRLGWISGTISRQIGVTWCVVMTHGSGLSMPTEYDAIFASFIFLDSRSNAPVIPDTLPRWK